MSRFASVKHTVMKMPLVELLELDELVHDLIPQVQFAENQQIKLLEGKQKETSNGCYQQEMVSCGKCKNCLSNGPSHGPYWYLYYYVDGQLKKKYFGKHLPPGVLMHEQS
jgi:hypothetical protein